MAYFYTGFGVVIKSYTSLPSLNPSQNEYYDIEIKAGQLKPLSEDLNPSQYSFKLKPDELLLEISGVANYKISDGKEIIVDEYADCDITKMKLFLLGTCFSALLNQRKVFQLHASAILVKGKAVLFSADSGAGKSTLMNSFLKRGYKMISDDVCAISFNEGGKPIVWPSYPQSKAWEETLTHLSMDKESLPKVHHELDKRLIAISSEHFHNEPTELGKIYFMESHHTEALKIHTCSGAEKFNKITSNIYRIDFIAESQIIPDFFATAMKIAQQVETYHLHRAKVDFADLDRIFDQIEEHFLNSAPSK